MHEPNVYKHRISKYNKLKIQTDSKNFQKLFYNLRRLKFFKSFKTAAIKHIKDTNNFR